ncbi:hypothetical protein B7P43_G07076 [Cryptotermes secundus]|uniref:Histone-lysine N-methyltransferase SETMAR n=1 Tax=Cryptotermes secundus TaxID=105785 RepID=A0A2J7RHC4_9NEOP|nr:hypothetical protein B7P43_G07076 [Cryptotermes secundus]
MLNRIVTWDESWVHHYQPESKCASVQWKHSNSPSTIKFKVTSTSSAGKVMFTVFLVSSECCEVLLKLRDAIRRKRPRKLARGVLLHHASARPHTARAAQKRIQELQWELLEHPPYIPELVRSDFRLFGPLKNHLGCKRFADGEVETEMRNWL